MSKSSKLSRREFLKRSSAVVSAGSLAGSVTGFGSANATASFPGAVSVPDLATHVRAFQVTPIYAAPDQAAEPIGYLFPDLIETILERSADGLWFKVDAGYLRAMHVQPVRPYQRPELYNGLRDPFWAEMIAPSSVIRQWCAPDAPLITRLEYGAVMYVMDYMPTAKQIWYGLAEKPGGERIGWATALHYARWQAEPIPAEIRSGDHVIRLQGISLDQIFTKDLPNRLAQEVKSIHPGASMDGQFGVPWLMRLEESGQLLYGAYWHNRFGMPPAQDKTEESSKDIQLPVLTARWLYNVIISTNRPVRVIFE